MANDYVLKVSYGGESLRVKLRVDKFTTMGQLRKLIVTAWPFLEEGVWKVILPNGGVLGQKGIKTPVVAYLSEDHKDPSGHVPELRLKIESSESPSVSAPSVGQQEGVQAVDGHPLAVNYWETCDVCGMFPIVGQWYICFTCRQKDLCFACRNGHAGGHKVISYAPSVDGIWENYGLFESLHRQAFKLRALGVPTVQPKFELQDIQKTPLPPMLARTFDEDEIPDDVPDRSCYRDRNKAMHYSIFCHCCSATVPSARRFKSDTRAPINLCDTCYPLHKDNVLALAYKCSRVWEPGRMAVAGDDRPLLAVHDGVTCTECEMSPITGARYTCLICSDLDLCSRCYHSRAQGGHKEGHAFAMVARMVTLWSLKMREPRGTPIGDMKCRMCGNHPRGGAKYRMKTDPPDSRNAFYCQSCYQKMLHKEAVQLRAPLASSSMSHSSLPWAQSARTRSRTLRVALKSSLASRLNTQPPVIQFIRRLARQAGRFDIIDDDDDSDSLEWVVEPPKEFKADHKFYDGPGR